MSAAAPSMPRAADAPAVVLASASAARAALLRGAGVAAAIDAARIDESEVKASLRAEGASAARTAETLAELKARRVSRHHPGALVIGADQMLDRDGTWFDKPVDRAQAAAHLRALAGRRHMLVTSVCVVRDGARLWHHTAIARLDVRPLDDGFIDAYLDAAGDDALCAVGAYRLEGLGAQLFARIDGDYFTILGLPLLPLLDYLRGHGAIPR